MQAFLTMGHSDTSDLVKCHNGILYHIINTFDTLVGINLIHICIRSQSTVHLH